MLAVAAALQAATAHAQTEVCDQFKGVLAARIEATGVRGYSLDAVPARTPVPPDAKVIGTCEGGAWKVLYRRWGASRPSSASNSAPAPAPASATATAAAAARAPVAAAQAIVVPVPPAPKSPQLQGHSAAPTLAASAPSPTPAPVLLSDRAASAAPAPGPASEKAVVAGAGEVSMLPVANPAAPTAAAGVRNEAVVTNVPLARQASPWLAENWHWLWVLVLLPLAAGVWVWRAHYSAYDKTGLPRGPRL